VVESSTLILDHTGCTNLAVVANTKWEYVEVLVSKDIASGSGTVSIDYRQGAGSWVAHSDDNLVALLDILGSDGWDLVDAIVSETWIQASPVQSPPGFSSQVSTWSERRYYMKRGLTP
jgi:hypothetical protein